jgi:hypothetical protein
MNTKKSDTENTLTHLTVEPITDKTCLGLDDLVFVIKQDKVFLHKVSAFKREPNGQILYQIADCVWLPKQQINGVLKPCH